MLIVGGDDALDRAVRLALEPWGLSALSLDEPGPGATMPGSALQGRALAEAHDAMAVVWVSVDASESTAESPGAALWVYDRRGGAAISRPLPSAPPFDAATAAQVALIVKTLLRQGPVVPAAATPPSAPPAPSQDEPRPAPPHEHLSLGVELGARVGATEPLDAEPRIGLALTYWPEPLEHYLGITVRIDTGPGLPIVGPRLRARWTDTLLHVGARGRVRLTGPLDLGATAAIGLQISTLDGVAGPAAHAVGRLYVDPHAIADLELGLQLDARMRLALRGGASVTLRRQRFFAGEAEVLRIAPLSLRAALLFEIGLM